MACIRACSKCGLRVLQYRATTSYCCLAECIVVQGELLTSAAEDVEDFTPEPEPDEFAKTEKPQRPIRSMTICDHCGGEAHKPRKPWCGVVLCRECFDTHKPLKRPTSGSLPFLNLSLGGMRGVRRKGRGPA